MDKKEEGVINPLLLNTLLTIRDQASGADVAVVEGADHVERGSAGVVVWGVGVAAGRAGRLVYVRVQLVSFGLGGSVASWRGCVWRPNRPPRAGTVVAGQTQRG